MPIKNSEIYILFDDGDVLNDNRLRGRQWQQLIGEFFSPRFGGEPELWGAANIKIVEDFSGREVPKLIYENREKSHKMFMDLFIEKWINGMFDYAGVERPKKKSYKKLYYNAAQFVDLKVKAAFPGVIESIKELYSNGYNLITSSGTESIELKFYLEGMGIKQYFKQFYGPDLINILKVDDAFYQAIFNDMNITSRQAIIIDDKPYYLNFAEKLGANVIQACLTGEFEPQFPYFITYMKKLPQIIEEIKGDIINCI